MDTSLSNGYVPPGEDLNITQIPEPVEGFIGLHILVDIHKCLSESKLDDDHALGVWVKSNYLQELPNAFEDLVRPIRDSDGFVNLDKAYRRARQLTGKAQDKWPFFDKNLKKLSATLVKNVVLGDAAMGTVRSDNNLPDSRSQASLSANDLSIHQAQELESLQPADRHRDQRAIGHKTPQRDRSPLSEDSKSTNSTKLGTSSSVEALRDAGAGKVRGPNGRYVIKDDPTPPMKNKPNITYVKRSRTIAAIEGESEEIDESSDEEVKERKTCHQTAPMLSESGKESPQDSNGSPANLPSAAATPIYSPMSAILAAEAEAVSSNLDQLPPAFTHKKRKSEPSITRGSSKRTRGSRGGVLGRPRKSETLANSTKSEPEESMEFVQPTSQPTSQPEDLASISTRRSSRKSAASALEPSIPWDPTDDVLFGGASQKHPTRHSTIAPPNGTTKPLESVRASKTSNDNQKAVGSIKNSKTVSSDAITAKASVTQAKAQRTPTSTRQKKRVSFSPETRVKVGNVDFFARITTTAGTQEVVLLREDLTHEVDLVERYAEWQLAGNASVSFEVFKKIVKFARLG